MMTVALFFVQTVKRVKILEMVRFVDAHQVTKKILELELALVIKIIKQINKII